MEIINRIQELVDAKTESNSKRSFASIIGVPERTFSTYLKTGRTPSLEVIDAILVAFPDVSAEWLLRGEGEMYKSEMVEDNTPMVIKGDSGLTILDMPIEEFFNEIMANNRMFRQQLILANERNKILKDEIERLQQLREKKRG